jgi:hypothetical protein
MGMNRVLRYVAGIDAGEFISDLSNHSSEYCKKKHGLNKKEYTASLKHFGIPTSKIGFHWCTDGVTTIRIADDMPTPDGFHSGRVVTQKSTMGYAWYHRGDEKTLVKPGENPPDGWAIGRGTTSNKGMKLYTDGKRNFYLPADAEAPTDCRKGMTKSVAVKVAAMKRKTFPYNNGENEIWLRLSDEVPTGYAPGKLSKLSMVEVIKRRDARYESDGYIAVKSLTRKQLSAYQQLRDKTDLITDVIAKPDVYTYINKKYVKMLDEYSATNHSKGTSVSEQALISFIKSIYGGEVITNCKSVLKDADGHYYEMDAYLPDKHVGIEYNGTYWHCSLRHDKNYHYNKSLIAENAGIRLIHIYEHEWKDSDKSEKIKSLLRIALGTAVNRMYARECKVREITNAEAKPFNEANHLQGHRNAQVTYGLFHDGRLVQLMSFSKTKYNRNLKGDNDWEIIRGCPGSNNVVVGGVSKLFKHFLRDKNPDSVFSYCDFNKFDGRGYEAIGMRFVGYTGPNKWWVLPKGRVVERSPSKYREYKEQAVASLYGSGSKKYLYNNADR